MASTGTPSKRWREADTIKFVELYEHAESLWNTKHPQYKIRAAREMAAMRIVEEMNLPDFGPQELKTKIKNIRSTYQQEINKIRRAKLSLGSDVIEEYQTNLAWFPIADRFLSKVIKSTKKPLAEEPLLFSMEYGDTTDGGDEENFTLKLDDIKQEIEVDDYALFHQQPEEPEEKKPRVSSNAPDQVASVGFQDEWYHFGHNVACQLRNLPLERALECQQKILQILMQERLKGLGGEG